MAILETLRDLSILGVAGMAMYGLDAWRREHTGRRQIELAEETLALFYEARDVIKHIRAPMSFGSETADIERVEGETEQDWVARRNASVAYRRYDSHRDLFSRIHSLRYRFMAQIGRTEAEPFQELRSIVTEILSAADALARLWPRGHFRTEDQLEVHHERVEKYEAIFWDTMDEDDPINPRLEALFSRMEATCQKVISGGGTLYGILNRKLGVRAR
ncbi:MAG: hypothetical protein ACR2P5_04865 [Gammaproteobacteria bacterium]